MSEQELLEENERLKERIKFLEYIANRGSAGNSSAYNSIRLMILEKVQREVEFDIISGQKKNWTQKRAEKKIMSDLKWDLRVRTTSDFKAEHVESAKEYINNYIIPEEFKKSKWN